MKLGFTLKTVLTFDSPVTNHVFRLRMLPAEDAQQTCLESTVRVIPSCRTACLVEPPFGNRVVSGRIDSRHEIFSFQSSGIVEIDRSGLLTTPAPHMARQSLLTRPGDRIMALYGSLEIGGRNATDTASAVCSAVNRAFSYRPGSTSTETTAEEALSLGCGVCQDYAHTMLSLLRLAGIPALYVTGLVIGTGASHAWVEYWDGGKWMALDPTHNRICGEEYIVFARGADFSDACIERGLFAGDAKQKMTAHASVEIVG